MLFLVLVKLYNDTGHVVSADALKKENRTEHDKTVENRRRWNKRRDEKKIERDRIEKKRVVTLILSHYMRLQRNKEIITNT